MNKVNRTIMNHAVRAVPTSTSTGCPSERLRRVQNYKEDLGNAMG